MPAEPATATACWCHGRGWYWSAGPGERHQVACDCPVGRAQPQGETTADRPALIGIDLAAGPDSTVCCPQPIGSICPACGEMDGSGYCGTLGMETGRTVIYIRDEPRSPWK